MSLLKKIRTKETYLEKIQTLAIGTQVHIKRSIDDFENFSMEKFGKANIIPDMKEADEEQIFDTLQMWITWSNKTVIAKTVRNKFYSINNYLHYMGIKLHEKDIKQELTFPREIHENLYGVKLVDLQTIFDTMRYKSKTTFICQLSGLMRIGELVQLRKKHVIDMGSNYMIQIPANIAKFNKGRTTFWSKEATKMVRPILKKLEDDDFIFQKNKDSQNAVIAVEQIMRRALDRVGLDMRYESTNRYMINTHSMRAYGITKLSRHDPNFAKFLAGHKGYMLDYDRLDDDEKLELYRKYEGDLLIDKDAIQKATINKLEEKLVNQTRDDVKHVFELMDISEEEIREFVREKKLHKKI